ncbi:MAG: tryptophan--tRNA ligase [Candidatus Wildermuthbacteria bacterium]|nr:tryptophan--tRNA ligase [Candidatus Wildermuthbacteria bacterium]
MRIFSGIQPTGKLHIGSYLGAIKQWVKLQEREDCLFMIADLHALTVSKNPKTFQKEIFELAIELIAAGLNPERCAIFVQSQVKEHSELMWFLNTLTPLGELERMTQFKEKSKQFKQSINAGLLNYPILQAADILLYLTDAVPVGKDQVQHLELARAIAEKFNKKFGETFKIPKPLLLEIGTKITALNNPKKKMSKSSPETCLFLADEPEEIQKKIMSSVTDAGKTIKYDPDKKPGISNLLIIYSLFSEKPVKDLEKKFKGKGYAEFKKSLVQLLIEKLEPFRRKRKELLQREVYVKEILERGRRRAEIIAQSTMTEVRIKMGLV